MDTSRLRGSSKTVLAVMAQAQLGLTYGPAVRKLSCSGTSAGECSVLTLAAWAEQDTTTGVHEVLNAILENP